MKKNIIGKRTVFLVLMLVIGSVFGASSIKVGKATGFVTINAESITINTDTESSTIEVGKPTGFVTINAGSITINTDTEPDTCTVSPTDNSNIDVGNGATVRVEVSYSINCPGWDDHGYVDISFGESSGSDSADSGTSRTGTLYISKHCDPGESFTVILHAKITYTYGGSGSEVSGISHDSTAGAPPQEDPALELTPSSWTFPDTKKDASSSAHAFILKNTGGGTATGSVYLTGSDSSQFMITMGSGSFSLARDQTKTIWVKFCPSSEGGKSALLTADGNNCPDVSSSLGGTGTKKGSSDDLLAQLTVLSAEESIELT